MTLQMKFGTGIFVQGPPSRKQQKMKIVRNNAKILTESYQNPSVRAEGREVSNDIELEWRQYSSVVLY